ncbi:hypothetical protein CVT26_008900 [Gymnopilus dilepis]|uniref:Uncharacterized protein n=1 Tax=Gymnopilus dilepis TaxID=231916 RepID=A0A409YAU5_9AGAR|nr:hypothetical protein CVT26_008900 [Gymnopilus dilepis]
MCDHPAMRDFDWEDFRRREFKRQQEEQERKERARRPRKIEPPHFGPPLPTTQDTINEDSPRSPAGVLGPQSATTSVAVTTAETRRKQSTRPEDAATHETQAVHTQVHDAFPQCSASELQTAVPLVDESSIPSFGQDVDRSSTLVAHRPFQIPQEHIGHVRRDGHLTRPMPPGPELPPITHSSHQKLATISSILPNLPIIIKSPNYHPYPPSPGWSHIPSTTFLAYGQNEQHLSGASPVDSAYQDMQQSLPRTTSRTLYSMPVASHTCSDDHRSNTSVPRQGESKSTKNLHHASTTDVDGSQTTPLEHQYTAMLEHSPSADEQYYLSSTQSTESEDKSSGSRQQPNPSNYTLCSDFERVFAHDCEPSTASTPERPAPLPKAQGGGYESAGPLERSLGKEYGDFASIPPAALSLLETTRKRKRESLDECDAPLSAASSSSKRQKSLSELEEQVPVQSENRTNPPIGQDSLLEAANIQSVPRDLPETWGIDHSSPYDPGPALDSFLEDDLYYETLFYMPEEVVAVEGDMPWTWFGAVDEEQDVAEWGSDSDDTVSSLTL